MPANYRQKYLDLRAKHLKDCDTSYRLGYEAGLKESQIQQMQQQMQQQQMMQQQMMQQQMGGGQQVDENGQPIAPEQGQEMGGEMPPEQGQEMGGGMEEMAPEQGSELDQHIQELSSLVAKGEKPLVTDLRKKIEALASLRQSQLEKLNKKKKTEVHPTKSFVKNIVAKFESESLAVTENLEDIIRQHGIDLE